MASRYAFENRFRDPFEFLVGLAALGFGFICVTDYSFLALDVHMGWLVAAPFFILAVVRLRQGWQILAFRKRLLQLKAFAYNTIQVPLSKKRQYLGRGFRWLPEHRQRLSLLNMVQNQGFMEPSKVSQLLRKLRVLKPLPEIGGKPWLHGVGAEKETAVYVPQANRNSHMCVFGMTRVGKTRFLSTQVNQDIRNGEAVLVLDPKGDLEVVQDMYCAAKAAGRLEDMQVLHCGFPELSAKYNPLSSFSNVSEVASRITSGISGEGQGQQFKDFAWQYLNITAQCLYELGDEITYQSMAYYVKRPEDLLLTYVDRTFSHRFPDFESHLSAQIKRGKPRAEAIKQYVQQYIEQQQKAGATSELLNSVLVPLFNAATLDQSYYHKITSSVGPVLDKITQTQAGAIFAWKQAFGLPVIKLEECIKRKKIVYIGLDSLTNQTMAEAVGKAIIADLVSLCGRLYSETSRGCLNLHCDEFSNIVQDEFINLLNKAGGAGIRVTAYTQTVNDLGAAFGSNRDKPKMLLGNFGNIVMLRVSNEDTAEAFTRCLQTVKTRSTLPSTMANDRADGNDGELFTTFNTDIITEEEKPMIEVNDVFSLPKGQAFAMTNGGELYKIRMPLPKNDGTAPNTFETLLSGVNLCFA